MSRPRLKRCPFCGGRARIKSNGIGDFYVECDDENEMPGRFISGCGSSTSAENCETETKAAKRWNRRAAPQGEKSTEAGRRP